MIKLLFLGSGGAFTNIKDNFQSNMVLEVANGKKMLIDCGSDIRHSLAASDLCAQDLDAVYISHFHADHVGGLEWLALNTKLVVHTEKPWLIAHDGMLSKLWNQVLSGGLESLENEHCDLSTYFNIYSLMDECHFTWQDIRFEMVKTIHVIHDHQWVPSYGLFFSYGQSRVFITTDTQFCPDIHMPFYEKATHIFHDCQLRDQPKGIHARLFELHSLPEKLKAKMWLYHYEKTDPMPDVKARGFAGLISRGQRFTF